MTGGISPLLKGLQLSHSYYTVTSNLFVWPNMLSQSKGEFIKKKKQIFIDYTERNLLDYVFFFYFFILDWLVSFVSKNPLNKVVHKSLRTLAK